MTISHLKEEIQSIVEARGVKTIQKDYSQVLSDIEKALEFYKKNKDTDKKDAFVEVLKKLGEKKKKLAQELDDKVSGMYKNAEYQGESVVNEMAMGFDSMTGLFYLKGVPFTKERIKEVILFMKSSKPKTSSNQFEMTSALIIKDKVNKGEVTIDSKNLKTLIEAFKRHKNLASDKDFN